MILCTLLNLSLAGEEEPRVVALRGHSCFTNFAMWLSKNFLHLSFCPISHGAYEIARTFLSARGGYSLSDSRSPRKKKTVDMVLSAKGSSTKKGEHLRAGLLLRSTSANEMKKCVFLIPTLSSFHA